MESTRERIVKARKMLKMSQKDFSIQIDVPYRSLQNYESGISENIPHTFLEKLIENTSINANWLLTGRGEMERQVEAKEILEQSLDITFQISKNNNGEVQVFLKKYTEGKE